MKTAISWLIRAAACAAAFSLAPGAATAQPEGSSAYPSRPMRIVVPYPAGGGTDVLARMIGQKFTETWGQPVIVENRPGANGWIGNGAVAKAAPDGYTILLTISTVVYAPYLYDKLPYDVNKDLAPVSMLTRTPNLLVVPASVPAATLEEFVDLMRKQPRKFSYGSYGQGSTAHVAGETLNRQAGLDLVHVAYKGAAPLVSDLLGGQIPAGFVDASTMRPHARSDKVRILAVSGTQRVSYLPDVPTFAERGYKGMELVGYFLMMAPAGTPKDIVERLNTEMVKILQVPEVKEQLLQQGAYALSTSPQQTTERIRKEIGMWAAVIQDAKITGD